MLSVSRLEALSVRAGNDLDQVILTLSELARPHSKTSRNDASFWSAVALAAALTTVDGRRCVGIYTVWYSRAVLAERHEIRKRGLFPRFV